MAMPGAEVRGHGAVGPMASPWQPLIGADLRDGTLGAYFLLNGPAQYAWSDLHEDHDQTSHWRRAARFGVCRICRQRLLPLLLMRQ